VGGAGEVVHPGYRAFVTRIGGDEGRAWVASVPGKLALAARRWGLELGPELPGGLLACVAEARTADGREAVLKLPSPLARARDEVQALRAWAGGGAPELLAEDEELGALLLERIRPGGHAHDLDAVAVAALLGRLCVPPFEGAPPLGTVVAGRLDTAEADRRATPQRLAWAREALERLEQAPPPPRLVHGDFDERNLLVCTRRGICAIDPLPAAGDALYDAASWIHANGRRGRRARFDALAGALGLGEPDRRRVRDWCGVVAVHG
jgi:streptomycin 6-kinase